MGFHVICVDITKSGDQIYQGFSSKHFCLFLLTCFYSKHFYAPEYRDNTKIYIQIDIHRYIHTYILLCMYTQRHTHMYFILLLLETHLFLMDSLFFLLEYIFISERSNFAGQGIFIISSLTSYFIFAKTLKGIPVLQM